MTGDCYPSSKSSSSSAYSMVYNKNSYSGCNDTRKNKDETMQNNSNHHHPCNIIIQFMVVVTCLFWSVVFWNYNASTPSKFVIGAARTSGNFGGDGDEPWVQDDDSQARCNQEHENEKVPATQLKVVQPTPMCEPFMLSPTTIWAENIERIHTASRLPKDTDFYNHDLHAALLQLVSPRLPASVRMVEKNSAKIQVLLAKAYERYQYLIQQQNTEEYNEPEEESTIPPPVVILVLGGSVTRGKYCSVDGHEYEIPLETCSWAGRLEKFVNALAGGELVRVHNMARGATDTRIGVVMLQNMLLPQSAQQPDIVISAYSTNDQTRKPNGYIDAEEALVREVMNWRPCQESKYQPIMIHFDEYMGGMDPTPIINLISTTTTHNFDTLSRYYGFSYISYADAIRDIIYGDVEEYFFSPKEWFETPGEIHKQLHPGQGMHISSSWVVAYNLLNLATTYCSFELWKVAEGEQTMTYNHTEVPGLPKLRSTVGEPDGKPRPMPAINPPSITSDHLDLSTVSEMWRSQVEESTVKCNDEASDPSPWLESCPFSWWWGDYEGVRPSPKQQISNTEDTFKPIVTSYGGWHVTYESNKMGWEPPSDDDPVGLEFRFNFPAYNETIRAVSLLYMKSYGWGWEGSKIDLQLTVKPAPEDSSNSNATQTIVPQWRNLTSTTISAYHEKKTSEVYAERIELPPGDELQPGSILGMNIVLIEGQKFKLMGLLVCS